MIDEVQKLIVRQCAFKGAIECIPDHVKWVNPAGKYEEAGAKELLAVVKYLTDKFEAIILGK